MWPDTRPTELFGTTYPIVLAPMAGSGTVELAAAVSNAGGLGSFGCGRMAPDELPSFAAALRRATNRPISLNFFAHAAPRLDPAVVAGAVDRLARYYAELGLADPDPRLDAEGPGFVPQLLDILLEAPPPVVSFHFGLPSGDVVARLRAARSRAICSATTVGEARALEDAGVDAIVAQGWEAGGHCGRSADPDPDTGVGLMALLPQVVDAVSVPVIAAGGIADGRGIAAALVLGASGVQIGSAFLSYPEAGISDLHRRALAAAGDTDTCVTRAYSGGPCRLRRNRYAAEMAEEPVPMPAFPLSYALTAPLRTAQDTARSTDFQFLLCGQAAALNRDAPGGPTGRDARRRDRRCAGRCKGLTMAFALSDAQTAIGGSRRPRSAGSSTELTLLLI